MITKKNESFKVYFENYHKDILNRINAHRETN